MQTINLQRPTNRISQPGVDYDVPAAPKVHPIRKLARLHHVCSVAVAEEYGVPLEYALDKLSGVCTSVYIEANRRGFSVTGDVALTTINQGE